MPGIKCTLSECWPAAGGGSTQDKMKDRSEGGGWAKVPSSADISAWLWGEGMLAFSKLFDLIYLFTY